MTSSWIVLPEPGRQELPAPNLIAVSSGTLLVRITLHVFFLPFLIRFEKDPDLYNRCVTRVASAYSEADGKLLVMKSKQLPMEKEGEEEDSAMISERNAFDVLSRLRGNAVTPRLNKIKVSKTMFLFMYIYKLSVIIQAQKTTSSSTPAVASSSPRKPSSASPTKACETIFLFVYIYYYHL